VSQTCDPVFVFKLQFVFEPGLVILPGASFVSWPRRETASRRGVGVRHGHVVASRLVFACMARLR
jgi:hypothetical protein